MNDTDAPLRNSLAISNALETVSALPATGPRSHGTTMPCTNDANARLWLVYVGGVNQYGVCGRWMVFIKSNAPHSYEHNPLLQTQPLLTNSTHTHTTHPQPPWLQ